MTNRKLIEGLLGTLDQYIGDLRNEQSLSLEAFQNDLKTQRYVEHTLQIAIQTCLDIAAHIISGEGWREFTDYRDAFTVLAENGVVDKESLKTLHRMAQFRNLIVHHYARVEPAQVYGILIRGVADLEEFARAIASWLARG